MFIKCKQFLMQWNMNVLVDSKIWTLHLKHFSFIQASAKPAAQTPSVMSPSQSTNPSHSSDPVYECTTSVVRSVMQLLQGVQKGQHGDYLELVKVSSNFYFYHWSDYEIKSFYIKTTVNGN